VGVALGRPVGTDVGLVVAAATGLGVTFVGSAVGIAVGR
jgi:hypothetical protein